MWTRFGASEGVQSTGSWPESSNLRQYKNSSDSQKLHQVLLVMFDLRELNELFRYLLRTVLTSGLNESLPLTDLYDFIFDRWQFPFTGSFLPTTIILNRLRAVRQDLTLQQTEDIQILAACVRFSLAKKFKKENSQILIFFKG